MKSVVVFDNTATVECLECHVQIVVSTNNPVTHSIDTSQPENATLIPEITACPMCQSTLRGWQWVVANGE